MWRTQGRMCLTVITKATFGLVPDGVVRLVAPEELSLNERHRDDHPARSLVHGGDVDPYKPRVDVLFSGHAYAPAGHPEPAVAVRLGIYGQGTGLEKTLHVIGERSPASGFEPQPFQKMLIQWERAAAGSGAEENPVGVPAIASGNLPNIIDPANPERPAGFGPIARTWPSRLRYLGGGTAPREDGVVLDVPETLAWEYFQVAPADQQLDKIVGNEQIVLDNLHASLPRIQSQLPDARGVARVFGGDAPADGFPIELDLDTLSIDGDRQTVSIVWRGCLMIEGDPAELRCLRVATGVEMPGFPMPWHQAQPSVVPKPAQLPNIDVPESTRDGEGGTLAFSPEEAQRLIASAAARAGGVAPPKPSSIPPAPRTGPPPAPPAAPRVSQLDLEPYQAEAQEHTAVTAVTKVRESKVGTEPAKPAMVVPDISDEVTNFDEKRQPPSTKKSGGGTRALTPEESAKILANAPKGPPLNLEEPPAPPPPSGGQSTRALTPEESAKILANAPKRSPLAPPGEPTADAPPAGLPGASQFLAQARGRATQPAAMEEPSSDERSEDELTDEETGATLAVNPDQAAQLLSNPVRAIVHPNRQKPEE